MPQAVHDTYAKDWLTQMLTHFGTVEAERQISSNLRKIDLIFNPDPDRIPTLQSLGLLGRILSQPTTLEFFRNPVPALEIVNCRYKITGLRFELIRIATTQKQKIPQSDLPILWILTPTLSTPLKRTFHAQPKRQWEQGIYSLLKHDYIAIIAIHELPTTLDTLWIRLLGRGKIQAQAIKELLALPSEYLHREETLYHLSMLQVNLEMRQNKTKDLKEIIMNLAPAYEEWRTKTIIERNIQIARRMLSKRMPLAEIAELTDLTVTQIQSLQSEQS